MKSRDIRRGIVLMVLGVAYILSEFKGEWIGATMLGLGALYFIVANWRT